MAGKFGTTGPLAINPVEKSDLSVVLSAINTSISNKEPIPRSAFEQLSTALGATLQNPEWANRPRIWFILTQINRLDAMVSFIAQGLNDTSLPLRRDEVPNVLKLYEFSEIEKWQKVVHSDTCDLEKGRHITIDNGDVLFHPKTRRLGVGGSKGSTVVDKVTVRLSGNILARKRINRAKNFGHDRKSLKLFENELKALSRISDHDHLIKVKGTYTDKKYLALLLEPVADMNLKQYMIQMSPLGEHQFAKFRSYFGCLARTLRFLHEPPISMIHKDLKPENVLLKGDQLILTDFGTAYDWSATGQSMTMRNASDERTPRYSSPEVANAGTFHRTSDIWSLGILFLEMVTVLRGFTLEQMNEFLRNPARDDRSQGCTIHPYQDLDRTLKWFESLRSSNHGSLLDNEPLAWIKQMLNRQENERPTGNQLFEEISEFQYGMYCGNCCRDDEDDSESASESFSETDGDSLLEDAEQEQTLRPIEMGVLPGTYPSPLPPPPASTYPDISVHFDTLPNEPVHPVTATFDSSANLEESTSPVPMSNPSRSRSRRKSVGRGSTAVVEADGGKTKGQSAVTTSSAFIMKKEGNKISGRGFPGMDSIVQWLSKSQEKLKMPQKKRLPRTSKQRNVTVESQRIGHFLSSLPESTGDFVGNPFADDELRDSSSESFATPGRSSTQPLFTSPKLKHSYSDEDLQSSDDESNEETPQNDLIDMNISKLVKSGSESNIVAMQNFPKEDRKSVINELRDFAAQSLTIPKSPSQIEDSYQSPEMEAFSSPPDCTLPTKAEIEVFAPSVPPQTTSAQNLSKDVPLSSNVLRNHLENLRRPSAGQVKPQIASGAEYALSSGPSLATYIESTRTKQRDQRQKGFESATVIMDRIMKNKTAEAPTTILSTKTRSLLSHGRVGMRWNDKCYGYLPHYTASGQASAVRQLLKSGCNPATEEKPRWRPIYNTIVGASDRHTKCLRALVEHGVDVNAVKSTHSRSGCLGRRSIHYAIEQKVWPGYSTMIYVLLAAHADPNAKDSAGEVPLLMLLVGNSKLAQEKRDALYLLLAPNFATELNVTLPSTKDNPLHLAIRRKDAYVVDAILEKLKVTGDHSHELIHERNSTGFSPLLLAFSVLPMSYEEEAEDLRIVELLLDNGANPNDRDIAQGETPMHRVVRDIKNAVALELLLRHAADPKIRDKNGKSSLNSLKKLRNASPGDKWYLYTERRLERTLGKDDYRPPNVVSYFADVDQKRKAPENGSQTTFISCP